MKLYIGTKVLKAKPMSREEAITQYNNLTDPRERGEFFETHKQLFI